MLGLVLDVVFITEGMKVIAVLKGHVIKSYQSI